MLPRHASVAAWELYFLDSTHRVLNDPQLTSERVVSERIVMGSSIRILHHRQFRIHGRARSPPSPFDARVDLSRVSSEQQGTSRGIFAIRSGLGFLLLTDIIRSNLNLRQWIGTYEYDQSILRRGTRRCEVLSQCCVVPRFSGEINQDKRI